MVAHQIFDKIKIQRLSDILLKDPTKLAKKDRQNLISQVNSTITKISGKISKKDLSAVIDLFQAIDSSGFRNIFAADIEPDQFYILGKKLEKMGEESIIGLYLNIFRSPAFLKKIYEDNRWPDLILNLLKAANYTFAKLFHHRCRQYPKKVLFSVLDAKKQYDYTWSQVEEKVLTYAKGLMALQKRGKNIQRVAFFTKNSLDMALFDLACLTSGIVNVMIPVNSVPAHVEYILNKTEPHTLIISQIEQLEDIDAFIRNMNFLKAIIILSSEQKFKGDIYSIPQVVEMSQSVDSTRIQKSAKNLKLDDLISIMFTSGTTGNPKGIMFSHQNIVFKRFARAMALPEIGEEDIFLCYLPLFHTFGRWFEMTGSIFWAARYVFMENPSVEAMIENMQRIKPSIFISIPKKWYQMHEHIGQEVDLLTAPDEEIRKSSKRITGGNLKWGLSAAGYLDPEIFQFFQRNGIELMSGFGMTEATGGITMTPPGQYIANSIGKPLPGISTKFNADGELLIKGPYVMMGYSNPEESGEQFEDGWLPTGDIMKTDERGFIRIVDRKKEIYKNIKGETIAPQKIENHFREFDFIKHVFLVGDHKPFNTMLIYPNYDFEEIDFRNMNKALLRNYFGSIIVSVNRFLAPYERIVDFEIINRDFTADEGELTPKGSYKRSVIARNFKDSIDPMYKRNFISRTIAKLEVLLPNWFLREQGITANEIGIKGNSLFLMDSQPSLIIKLLKDSVRIGDYSYRIKDKKIDLGLFLVNPILWLGNEALVHFTGQNIYRWSRLEDMASDIQFEKVVQNSRHELTISNQVQSLLQKSENNLIGLHNAALLLRAKNTTDYNLAINYLESVSKDKNQYYAALARILLERTAHSASLKVQKKAFYALLRIIPDKEFKPSISAFLENNVRFLSSDLISEICQIGLTDSQLEIIFSITLEYCKVNNPQCLTLLKLLSYYGAKHPTRFKIIRQFIATCQLSAFDKNISQAAWKARLTLRDGFREWLGSKQQVAVDPETEEEYTWHDVIIFEEDIDSAAKDRLTRALQNTILVREAVFLFSRGILVRLNDIPPGGVWVSFLGSEHGKSVFRLTIQTRYQGSFDVAVNVNYNLTYEEIVKEINWLIRAGTTAGAKKLVEDFGGYWKEYNLWTEEFIPGETTGKFLLRISRQMDEIMQERLSILWPYFIWSGVMDYVDFWHRTGRNMELLDPSPDNIIIPLHDYQTGSRIVSISARRKHRGPLNLMTNLYKFFVKDVEAEYPFLQGIGDYKYIFSAFLEVMDQNEGLKLLQTCLRLLNKKPSMEGARELIQELTHYIESVKKSGFIPQRLYFAIKRYQRWVTLNKDATYRAKAATLSELYDTYELHLLEPAYPETRMRYFSNTVFKQSDPFFRLELEKIINLHKTHNLSTEEYRLKISALQKLANLSEEDLYFILRMTYPHLSPTDSADLISLETGGTVHSDIVIQMVDNEGNIYGIRSPITPKEIARLQQLYITNQLPVQFKPEHRYLIAVNERGQLIGGIFFKAIEKDTIHLDKIVVERYYRKKGVSDGLLNEFFKRMKVENYRYITTGFFRPEYFYRFGFKIERKYAGLVKNLEEESPQKLPV